MVGNGLPQSGAGTTLAIDESSNIYIANVDSAKPINSGNVYVSESGIESWALVNSGQGDIGAATITVGVNNILYAGSFAPFYLDHSLNKWVIIPGGSGVHDSVDGTNVQALLPINNNLYAGTGGGNVGQYGESGFQFLDNQQTGALDGSIVSVVATNSVGDIYAATTLGNVWKFRNN